MAKERRQGNEVIQNEEVTMTDDTQSPYGNTDKTNSQKEAAEMLVKMNEHLKQMGMLELALVKPSDCLGQDVNARYFSADKMNQLVANVKGTGALESVPLVYRDEKLSEKYRIISGHHRIDAAKAAGLQLILVMVAEPKTVDEIVSKQLSHNSLVGEDDKAILAQLFDSIKEVSWRLASGLNDEASKVTYSSLSFRLGTFKEVNMLFLPPDLEAFDDAMEKLCETSFVKPSQEVRVISMDTFNSFAKALRKVKKVENIKNNSTAVMRMVELAMIKLAEIELEAETE